MRATNSAIAGAMLTNAIARPARIAATSLTLRRACGGERLRRAAISVERMGALRTLVSVPRVMFLASTCGDWHDARAPSRPQARRGSLDLEVRCRIGREVDAGRCDGRRRRARGPAGANQPRSVEIS